MFHIAKLRIFSEICVTIWLQKYFKVIDTEDAAVANLATFAGGKYLYVPPASVETVSQGGTVSEFEDRASDFQTEISTGSPLLSIVR